MFQIKILIMVVLQVVAYGIKNLAKYWNLTSTLCNWHTEINMELVLFLDKQGHLYVAKEVNFYNKHILKILNIRVMLELYLDQTVSITLLENTSSE